MSRLEQGAVELATRGYCVHPLRPGEKVPGTRTGFKDATRDERRVLHWWDRTPDANIGIACGASGVVVLDIDTKAGADPREILARFDRAGAPVVGTGLAPERSARHPRSLAGRRGVQVYFAGRMASAGRLTIDGCEIKGAGGYCVAPPSIHPCGCEYVGELPPVHDLPPVPAWLEALVPAPPSHPFVHMPMGRPASPSRVLAGLERVVREAPVSNRNRATFWASCRIAEHAAAGALDEHEAVAAIRAAALAAGLDEPEVDQTIRSGLARRTKAAA